MPKPKCIIVLSEKSSGSSALQELLASFQNIQHVHKTRHYENETLYWTKAASVLGMWQMDMVDSEVPIAGPKARADLVTLLQENLDDYCPPTDDRELIMGGWARLCETYAPIFLEKSPHHLCQWSALQLIVQCMQELRGVDFLIVGLVRNPMDVIYSQYRRWKSRPEDIQRQWLVAYRNLAALKEQVGDRLTIVRYEDMVVSLGFLQPVFDFCGRSPQDFDQHYFHNKSVAKWKHDALFGFAPSDDLMDLAGRYGYDREQLCNEPTKFWPVIRECSRARYRTVAPLKSLARHAMESLHPRPGPTPPSANA